MTRKSYLVMVCDRCGKTDDNRDPMASWEHQWGQILVTQPRAAHWIGSPGFDATKARDLCPDCARTVYEWFHEKHREEERHAPTIRPVPDYG